jgi:hypothetical protein
MDVLEGFPARIDLFAAHDPTPIGDPTSRVPEPRDPPPGKERDDPHPDSPPARDPDVGDAGDDEPHADSPPIEDPRTLDDDEAHPDSPRVDEPPSRDGRESIEERLCRVA